MFGLRSVSTVLAAALLSLALKVPAVWACSCMAESRDAMVARADLAIVASPVATALFDAWGGDPEMPRRPPRAVTIFHVQRVLEGRSGLERVSGRFSATRRMSQGTPVPERVAVLHALNGAACGLVFDTGRRYLLAFRIESMDEPAPLRIGLCSVKTLGPLDRRDAE